jgi:hypothetical protein
MSSAPKLDQALTACLISPNVSDSNLEPANVVDVISDGAKAIRYAAKHLGKEDASDPMGAIEFLARETHDASERIADGLSAIAGALEQVAEAIITLAPQERTSDERDKPGHAGQTGTFVPRA